MVILKFTSPTCGPCIQLNAWLDAQDSTTLPTIVAINVQAEPKKAKQYGIFQVPCMLVAEEVPATDESEATYKEVKPSSERVFGFKVAEMQTLFDFAKNG